MNGYKTLKPEELSENVFKLLVRDVPLVTAGSDESYNLMPAAWGGFGCLWDKWVSYIFIRRSRYTAKFMDEVETYTFNFFDEDYRDTINLCGRKSGRDFNKMKELPFTTFTFDDGSVAFNEARLIMKFKKLAVADVKKFDFVDKSLFQFYENNDYHNLYIGEFEEILIKE